MATLPALPPSLKSLSTFMRIALDLEKTDPTTAYWIRFYCIQTGLKLTKENRSKEDVVFFSSLLECLEKEKKLRRDNEAITNEMVGQAHVENYALQLFQKADTDDREGRASKNTSRQFLIASQLFEVLTVFGELSEDIFRRVKYAKWKAIYISRCLKNGETPVPGPVAGTDAEEINFPEIPSEPSDNSVIPPNDNISGHSTNQITGQLVDTTLNDTPILPNLSSQHNPEHLVKARKYCNFAGSALQYEDVPTAIDYLQKALSLLKTGSE